MFKKYIIIFVILDICFYKLLMLLFTEWAFTLSTYKKKKVTGVLFWKNFFSRPEGYSNKPNA